MNTKYLICLFALVNSILSCKKKDTPKEIFPISYQVFDSCTLYRFRSPTTPWSEESKSNKYLYSRNEPVSFDTAGGFTCTIRDEKFTYFSTNANDSIFILHNSKQFSTGHNGFLETKLTFKGDSLLLALLLP